jgi:hypothetical protein
MTSHISSSHYATSSSTLTKAEDEKGESDLSWDQASYTKSLASLSELNKRASKAPRKVQFKSEVMAFHVDRDFWKFKCQTEPLCETKRQSKSLENLKSVYNEKLVKRNNKRTIKA